LGTGVNWENMVTWWKCREKRNHHLNMFA
jgi:hypothetical protein